MVLARSGDPDAFEALVASRRAALLRLLVAVIGDGHEAEDALQEGLWQAFRGMGGLREPRAFDGWLRQVITNTARSFLRAALVRLKREAPPFGTAEDLETLVASGYRPSVDDIADRERYMELLGRISGLPAQQRRVAGLVWVAQLPAREAARIVGLPTGHVYAALHRARRTLSIAPRGSKPVAACTVRIRTDAITGGEILPHLRRVHPEVPVEVARTLEEAHVHDSDMKPTEVLASAAAAPTAVLPLGGLVGAFTIIASIVSQVPVCAGHLPDYRTRDIMRAWTARRLPRGKECLLELDAGTHPLLSGPSLWQEAVEPFEALAGGTVSVGDGMAAVRAKIAERAAAGLRGFSAGSCRLRSSHA